MPSTSIVWKSGGAEVFVAGEFTDWQPRPAQKQGDVWQFTIDLQPGSYTYKWVVDGNWLVDDTQTTQNDEEGHKNNVLIIEAAPPTPEPMEDSSVAPVQTEAVEVAPVQSEAVEITPVQPEAVEIAPVQTEVLIPEEARPDSGEGSGDSDSWERVSVGDCAAIGDQAEPIVEDNIEVITVQDDASAKLETSNQLEVERLFSPGENFHEVIGSVGAEVDGSEYMVNYWDTPSYTLMKETLWLKQITDKWVLRKLEDTGVKTIKDRAEIEDTLSKLLGKKGTLDDLLEGCLTKNIQFEGATTRWQVNECEVQHVKEGALNTVSIRTRSGDGLNKIYSTAKQLKLQKFKLV